MHPSNALGVDFSSVTDDSWTGVYSMSCWAAADHVVTFRLSSQLAVPSGLCGGPE